MVYNVSSEVFGFKGNSYVWVDRSIDTNFVPLLDELIDHINMRSVGPSGVELSVTMIVHDGSLAF
jgi:hypothetical protein